MNTSFVKLTKFNELNTILRQVSDRINDELGIKVWLHVYPYTLGELTPESVVSLVANTLEVTEEQIYEHNRSREIVEARYIAMKIIRDNYKLSYTRIGLIFKNDHSTVIYAMNQVDDLMQSSKTFQDKFKKVSKQLMLMSE